MTTDFSALKNKYSSEQKTLLKSLPPCFQLTNYRVERTDLSTKWLTAQKRITDKNIFTSFYFYDIQQVKTLKKVGELTLTLCVIHSRPYWYTLLAAELSAF